MIEIRISDEAKSCADKIMANFISSGASASTAFIAAQAIEELLNQRDAELADIRRQLKGHPDSKLDGENGLAAATMRRLDQLEECCRTALWIQSLLEERGKWGANLEEWEEIKKAMDVASQAGVKGGEK